MEEKRWLIANEFVKGYGWNIPTHITDIVLSVMDTRDGVGCKGGSFVQAVVANKLYESLAHADLLCKQYLHVIAAANGYCWER